MAKILICYYSKSGNTKEMAELIAELITHKQYLHVTDLGIEGYLFYHQSKWMIEIWIDGDPVAGHTHYSIQGLYKRVREEYGDFKSGEV